MKEKEEMRTKSFERSIIKIEKWIKVRQHHKE